MKNRTIIGIICIAAALVLSFAAAPLVNKLADKRFEIVCMKKDVAKGHMLTEADIQTVTVGGYGLPTDLVKDKKAVIGKYAAADLKMSDFLLPSKLSDSSDSADDVFMSLDGSKAAMSITIQSFAGGLSGKLTNGDIVRLIVCTDNAGKTEAFIPEALQFVRVITSTTADGIDKDELTRNDDGSLKLPTTLTLLVDPYQARLLAGYENIGKIHTVLISRGKDEQAEELLKRQDEILKKLAENAENEKNEVIENG